MSTFWHLKVGDHVVRLLAGEVLMEMVVLAVDETLITCNALEHGQLALPPGASLWTFDRATGIEVDHLLRFGPTYGRTGSALIERGGG